MPSRTRCRCRSFAAALFASALLLPLCACVFTRDSVVLVTADTPRSGKRRAITAPVKAHLRNGSVVLFPQGLTIDEGALLGAGEEYDLARTQRTLVHTVPSDQVAAIEAYEREVRPVPTTTGTLVALFFILTSVGLLAGGP
jgi:hypothetical protein